jgi:methyl-accepting chemotaxis protein
MSFALEPLLPKIARCQWEAQAAVLLDRSGTILQVNPRFCALFGYGAEELTGAHQNMLFPKGEADRPAVREQWSRLTQGEALTTTLRRLTKAGEERWLHANYLPILDETGQVAQIYHSVADRTAAELHRMRLEGEHTAVAQSFALIEFDPTGVVVDANDNFCAIMAINRETLIGRHHASMLFPEEREHQDYASFWPRLAQGHPATGEFRGRRSDGREVFLSASYMPVFDRDGRVFRVVKVAQVSHARQQMEWMRSISQSLAEAGRGLGQGTGRITLAVDEQRLATSSQAAAIAQVTSSLSELRQTSTQALEQAQGLLEVAEQSQEVSVQGAEVVSRSLSGMHQIRDRVEAIQTRILALSDHTAQIADIITTVNEVAEQSKLLALNASIEAARAGEFGKSFSVVANEMRDLAEQSKGATRQVRQLLSDIREATGAAVVATEDGIAKVEEGQQLATRAGTIMERLGGVISQSVDASRLIANAARQQGAGVGQVADAMVSIDGATRNAARGMNQIQAAIVEVRETAAQVAEQVVRLQSAQDEVIAARTSAA